MAACVNIAPSPATDGHRAAAQSGTPPFTLGMSTSFEMDDDDYSYTPGEEYDCKFYFSSKWPRPWLEVTIILTKYCWQASYTL